MKASLNWLREYVDITLPVAELGKKLTMSGTEVDSLESVGGWDNIVVGEVVAIEPHPHADHLQLATVNLGTERPSTVCGAPNLKLGQKVPFARLGAQLLDPETGERFKLKKAKIRGVASEGMICSEMELGISERHEGIMVLPASRHRGAPSRHPHLSDANQDHGEDQAPSEGGGAGEDLSLRGNGRHP